MDAKSLLDQLRKHGVTPSLDGDRLRLHHAERLSPELRQAAVACRRELAALLACPTAPAPGEAASAPPIEPATWTAREPSGQADEELRRARQLAENWLAARVELEKLILSAAERKSFPYLRLGAGTYLLPGRQAWTAYVQHPCTQPESLVHLLEALNRNPP